MPEARPQTLPKHKSFAASLMHLKLRRERKEESEVGIGLQDEVQPDLNVTGLVPPAPDK